MKILVLSDSHSGLSFMRLCIQVVKPDAVIHLGDYYDDGQTMAEENPQLPFYLVPGNCDRYRCPPGVPEGRQEKVCGVKLYMTHGHLHNVKLGTQRLLNSARSCHVQAVLYGHTHRPDCRQEEDGLWVLNPGSCGYLGGTAGLIVTENDRIRTCRILSQAKLEAMA